MTKTYDIESFYAGLVQHGLIIPVGVQGIFGRGPQFERILEAVDALVLRIAAADRPDNMTFPPVINRQILEKVHYLDSFPHLCGAVHSFYGNELESKKLAATAAEHGDWGAMLKMTDVTMC